MKNKLMKITDMTMSELLSNEVIMPSVYFETFDKNAKELEIEILEDNFEHEINRVLVEEFNNISQYMNKTISNIEQLNEVTSSAEVAIERNDKEALKKVREELKALEHDMHNLKSLIFIDSLTKAYNRKWIYKKLLTDEGAFKQEGIFVLLQVNDLEYIQQQYGEFIANNVLVFVTNFLNKKLKNENINFQLARYCQEKFMLFIEDESHTTVQELIFNLKEELLNTTLKSKSGIMFKTGFKAQTLKYIKDDLFQTHLEKLMQTLKEAT